MLSILTLNIKGLVSHQKQIAFYEYCKNTHSNLIFLQETNLSHDTTIVNPEKCHFFINPPTQPQSGVAIVFQTELFQQTEVITHLNLVPGYLQVLNVKFEKKNYHLMNIYMPQNPQKTQKVICEIQKYTNNVHQDSTIIIAGDWNVTLCEKDRKKLF